MNALLDSFLQEARENLKFIEQNLEDVGSGDDELINAIFRAAHTLKGGSGIVGFEAVKDITHKAEDLLDQLRAKKLTYHDGMLDALYDAFDEVLNLIEEAEDSGDVVEANMDRSDKIIRYLDEMMGNDPDAVVAFSLPDAFVSEKNEIMMFEKFDFSKLTKTVPNAVMFDESSIEEEKVYAVMIDADRSCMVFGNDPVYALSLLGDKVKDVVTSLDAKSATTILEAKDEDEGLEMYMRISALVEASYQEIEDALYNFIDDVKLYAVVSSDVPQVMAPSAEVQSVVSVPEVEVEETSVEEAQIPMEFDENMLHYILEQQIEQLREIGDKETLHRVNAIAERCFRLKGETFSPMSESADAYVDAINTLINSKTSEVRTEVVETKAVQAEVKVPTVQKQVPQVSPEIPAVVKQVVEETKAPIETPIQKEAPKVVKKETESKESKKDVVGKVVKVDQASIDQLMSVVGELLVAKNSLPYLAESVDGQESEVTKRAIMEKYSFIDRLTSQLQDLTMSMRMLPISYVFDRYPKLVREISKKLGKKVRLTQEGGETKLDKNMIEMLADPLIHIIRNSLDHGIEMPDTRAECGKDAMGEITMKAYPESDRVMIEILDDGKGIDAQMVVNKVLEKGLIDPSKLDAMTENEKLNLIMLPGLSTAETISEYSGRGVGMDVVKKSIESFGGTIHLESSAGKGTKIILSIPVSLAVTTLLHVSMNGMHYGFPMDSVSETVKVSKESITVLNNDYYIYLRGEIIPFVVIGEMINVDTLDQESISVVVLDVKGSRMAVVVNELLGQLNVVQKPLQGLLADHDLIGGTGLLGNGQIMMIIDPVSLWEVSDGLGTNEVLDQIFADEVLAS